MQDRRSYAVEDVFGVVLLIAALFAFGLFNFKSDEPLVEAGLTAQGRAIVAGSVHAMEVRVEGREITLTGLADSEIERAEISNALKALDGRGRFRAEVEILAPAEPFTFTAIRSQGVPMRFSGATPTEAYRRTLLQDFGEEANKLTLAAGQPDTEWPLVIRQGLRALEVLEDGRFEADGQILRLSGAALTPAEAEQVALLMSDLPDGYTFTADLETLDDGSPLRLTASRNKGALQAVSGKLPGKLAESLPDGDYIKSPLSAPDGWEEAVQQGLGALDVLQNGYFALIGTNLTLTGEAYSQDAYDTVIALLADMPAVVSVSHQIVLADSGDPFALELVLSETGLAARGKVPPALAPRIIAALANAPLANQSQLDVAQISPGPVWWEAASLGTEAMRFFETAELGFDGATLTISGRVQGPPQLAGLTRHLEDMPDTVTLDLDATPIDDGTPLRMTLAYDGHTALVSGKLPEGLRVDMLAASLDAPVLQDGLVSTPKTGPTDWVETSQAATAVLALFEQGKVTVEGRKIDFVGVVRTPDDESGVLHAVAQLPDAYEVSTSLTFRDDGRPFGFQLVFDGRRAVLSGKVPQDLGPASQSAILGFPIEADGLDFAGIPADAEWWSAARAGLKALSGLSGGSLTLDAYEMNLRGRAADPAAVEAALARLSLFEEAFRITVDIRIE